MIGDEELVELGLRLMEGAESEAKGTERQRAIAFRDGMLIALLALRPAMRRRNLAALEIDRHLRRIGDTWIVAFAEDETKTGVALEFPWPQILLSGFAHWLDHWRPMLLRFTGRWSRPRRQCLVGLVRQLAIDPAGDLRPRYRANPCRLREERQSSSFPRLRRHDLGICQPQACRHHRRASGSP